MKNETRNALSNQLVKDNESDHQAKSNPRAPD